MPPVFFFHDAHTKALKSKGCETCHPRVGGRFVFTFKRVKPLGHKAETALYHKSCIGCHKNMAEKGMKTGPQAGECRLCHQKRPDVRSDWRAIVFDRSLHFRHISDKTLTYAGGGGKNCGACHHIYDPKLKKTVYVKGREEACRYCHKAHRTDGVLSYPVAAHMECVNCHSARRAKGMKAGPVSCSGCHSAAAQRKIRVVKDVPRIERNQPDAVLMAQWLPKALRTGRLPAQAVPPVAFNHLLHESDVSSCRDCHHASLAPCEKCHTVTGEKKGGDVSLAMAMHMPESHTSCIGCHDAQTRKPDCAGCHDQMPKMRFDQRDCKDCHSVSEDALTAFPMNKASEAAIAKAAVDARPTRMRMVKVGRIPKTIDIGILSNHYQAAEFPHRKIVLALFHRIKNNRLAAAFHDEPTTLCQGCHHHSPPSLTPPPCSSCHRRTVDTVAGNRPDLEGAFHGQCITCHQKMGIKKPAATDCTACHKRKAGGKALIDTAQKQVR